MASDLVERLRDASQGSMVNYGNLCHEAAKEIKRLRSLAKANNGLARRNRQEADSMRAQSIANARERNAALDEIERLRKGDVEREAIAKAIYDVDPFLRDNVKVEWGDGWLAMHRTEDVMIIRAQADAIVEREITQSTADRVAELEAAGRDLLMALPHEDDIPHAYREMVKRARTALKGSSDAAE